MKTKLCTILISFALFGCQQKQEGKTYVPRALTTTEDLNAYPKDKADSLSIYKYADADAKGTLFSVKFKDTPIKIQTNKDDQNSGVDKFSFAQFINTQKTTLLVQIADNSSLPGPFYIVTLKGEDLDVISLYRASKGAGDSKFTKGANKIGLTGFLINNDYFVTPVIAKVYPVKRQNEEERIQGLPFVNSPDRQTLVFLVGSSLYQVHYRTSTVFNQPLPASAPGGPALFDYVTKNFSWVKNKDGISFLKSDADDNKIVDMRNFK